LKPVERVLTFGRENSLVGILCEPPASERVPDAPAIITWNVGLHHRVGPYRIYVNLARRLAEKGFTTLRFDVSGHGDSDFGREDEASDSKRAMADVQTAMRALRDQRGFKRFVLVGFCSSVDAAHSLGAEDESVAGVVYLEGYGFRTRGYYMRYPLRLLDRNRWERRLRIWFPQFFGGTSEGAGRLSAEREEIYVRDYPEPSAFARDVAAMTARGVRLLFIYAGGDTTYIYRDQLRDMLGEQGRDVPIELDFNDRADHTFFVAADRERAVSRVVSFMERNFKIAASRAFAESEATETAPARAAGTSNRA
jgi:pimeloyl-ACP methyl ester carboxylesterase